MWLTVGRPAASPSELARAHQTCLDISLQITDFDASPEATGQREFCELTFHQITVDQKRLPLEWLSSALARIREACTHSPELAKIAHQVLGDCCAGLANASREPDRRPYAKYGVDQAG